MPTDAEILERIMGEVTAFKERAVKERFSLPVVHGILWKHEFDVLCRSGAQVMDQWSHVSNDSENPEFSYHFYYIVIVHKGIKFFYGSVAPIEIPPPSNAPS